MIAEKLAKLTVQTSYSKIPEEAVEKLTIFKSELTIVSKILSHCWTARGNKRTAQKLIVIVAAGNI